MIIARRSLHWLLAGSPVTLFWSMQVGFILSWRFIGQRNLWVLTEAVQKKFFFRFLCLTTRKNWPKLPPGQQQFG
jgi:hypothetical protein